MPELKLGLEMEKWKTFMNILQNLMVILLHIFIHKPQIQKAKINQQK